MESRRVLVGTLVLYDLISASLRPYNFFGPKANWWPVNNINNDTAEVTEQLLTYIGNDRLVDKLHYIILFIFPTELFRGTRANSLIIQESMVFLVCQQDA